MRLWLVCAEFSCKKHPTSSVPFELLDFTDFLTIFLPLFSTRFRS